MHGQDILCGISKSTFEIPFKISHPYIERLRIYTMLKFEEILDLRVCKHFEMPPDLPSLKKIGFRKSGLNKRNGFWNWFQYWSNRTGP